MLSTHRKKICMQQVGLTGGEHINHKDTFVGQRYLAARKAPENIDIN